MALFAPIPTTFTTPEGFLYVPIRHGCDEERAIRRASTAVARESFGYNQLDMPKPRTGDLTGFSSGASKFFFSDFFLLIRPTLELINVKHGKDTKCAGLQIIDSDSIRLSSKDSPKGQCLLSPTELGEDPATMKADLRKLSSSPELLMIHFTDQNYTPDQIRNHGEKLSKSDEFERIGNGIWLICRLIADLYDAKIDSVRDWRAAGLEHINHIANKCEFTENDRHMINFLARHKEDFLEHGMAQTVARNIDDFPKELLELARQALGCETADVSQVIAKSDAKYPPIR